MGRHLFDARYRAVLSHTGQLLVWLAGCLLLPLASGLIHHRLCRVEVVAFVFPAAVSLGAGLALWRGLRPRGTVPIGRAEAALVVTVVWALATLLGALPFVVCGKLAPLDAVFEAMSGWTTTGLTMVTQPETFYPSLLLWRSLMQFIGGAGLAVVMLTAIVGGIGPGIYEAEARTEQLLPHVRNTARMIWRIYVSYAVLGVVLYKLCGLTLFDSLCHTMSGLATGGFSTHADNVAYFASDPAVNFGFFEAVTILLMVLGSISFATHHVLISSRLRKGFRDAELRTFVWMCALALPLVTLGIASAGFSSTPLSALRLALFQAISAATGTGYSTMPLGGLTLSRGQLALLALTVLMLIEGGAGSTAGGMKQYRIAILAKSVWWWIKKQFYPASAVIQRNIWRRGELLAVEDSHIHSVAALVALYLATYAAGVTVLMLDGLDMASAAFEYASALGTVGLSVGFTRPEMPVASKVAEILGMWLGRLEFVAICHAVMKVVRDVRRR